MLRFTSKSKALAIILLSCGLMPAIGFFIMPAIEDTAIISQAQFAGLGLGGVFPVMIFAFLQTGLSEEILFRGFLNKRLSNRFGFAIGNTLQAILFGLVHGILLFGSIQVLLLILVVA